MRSGGGLAVAGRRGLSGAALKWIAIIAMTTDHVAWALFPGFQTNPVALAMHIIGRLTAPIMMFMIVEGFFHTRDRAKYLLRLLAAAVAGHFAYAFLFGLDPVPLRTGVFNQTSVLWPFAMGLLALMIYRSEKVWLKPWMKQVLGALCLVAAFPGDWSTPGALAIVYMGMNHGNFKRQMLLLLLAISFYSIVYIFAIDPLYGALQMTVALAIPFLRQYNGTRGRFPAKWFFYAYYPLHMAAIALLIGPTFIF
jgi:hypothetical protein